MNAQALDALLAIPQAVLAGLGAGALLPLLGLWVVVQRVPFLGVTLAQVAAAGVALGLLLGAPPLALGMGATLVVAASIVAAAGRGGSARDGAGDETLAALFCASSALALVFISSSPADLDEVAHVLHGNLIYARADDVTLTLAALTGAVLLLALFRRPILFSVFDPETAAAAGLATRGWMFLLFAVLALVLALSMRTTGSLLSFAMLVLPALAALALRRGLLGTWLAASLLGLFGTAAGFLLAVTADLHLESAITLCLAAELPICSAFRRQPLAGAGTLTLALAAAAALAVARAEPAPDLAHPHHHAGLPDPAAVDWHVDVHLSARPAAGNDRSLSASWEIHLWRRDESVALPSQLWIVLTGDGVAHEHELLHDLALLPAGTSRVTGGCLLPAPAGLHRLDGQLWTGSPLSPDAAPLSPDLGTVIGTDVAR